MVLGRLAYIGTPVRCSTASLNSISVRPLRKDNEGEFTEYFRLRHRVYSFMGYLNRDVEECRSKLEINEADVRSIHLGAFFLRGARATLAGCARVVVNSEVDWGLQKMFERIAGTDPVAKERLREAYPLGLPIFQSHEVLNKTMTVVLRSRERVGELSRVIVDREFRGMGISKKLVAYALARAADQDLRRIFLECLSIHRGLYEGLGFRCIPGVEGTVVDVNRTMIAMELQIKAAKKLPLPSVKKQAVIQMRHSAVGPH